MKILLVQLLDYRFPFGGAHKANRRLMEALAARGHECQVFAPGYETVTPRPDERERLLADLAAEGAPVVAEEEGFVVYRSRGVVVHALVAGLSALGYERVYGHLARQIRELRPDWVLVSEDHTGLFLGAALELIPGRVVYIAHAQPTLPFGPEAFDQDPAKAALFARVAGILTVSDYVRGYIRRWGGRESTVIGFPVYGEPPFPRFGGFDQGAVTLVNASGLKGLPIFLDLAAAFPEVPFTAVASWGTGAAERAALTALPNVTLREPSPEIDEVLAGARILLAPSLWGEAFGVIAVEAMLRGIPVLASDLGGLPEAKLGVDYVLPVSPITEYRRPSPFEKPVPVLPPQDTAPWRRALERVLTGRACYERLAEESRRAALAFVAGLGAPAFEAYLRGLEDPHEAPRKAPGGSTLPHILMSTHGTHGDVLPFLTLGERLVRRGHRVTLVTHAVFADLARAAGVELIGLGDEESYRRLIEDTAELFTRPDDVFAASRAYLERQRIFDDDREELRRIDAACTADTVLVGRYEDVATLLVAEKRGLPLAWVLLSPSQIATARVRAELFGGELLGRLQELRAEAGLPPIASYTGWLARADRSLALWPGWLSDPEPRDLEAVGFVLNEPLETAPLPATVEALLAERPLLVSSGTTKIIRPEFFTATLEAASRAGLPVLALTRHRELLPAALSAGCHWFSYLPFTRLLPRVRAVVHHGGIGTIAHALAAGAPQLILAEGVDRPDNARRLARAGAAESLKPADWTPERIGQALGRLGEPAFAERCRALAEETRGAGALAAACDRIAELAGRRRAAAPETPRAAAPAGPAASVADTADTRLSQLSPEKRALLALRLAKKKGAGQRGIPRLPRAGAESFFPLSFAQERFWFLEQLKDQREPGGETVEAYTVAVASYHLAGPFRNDLLERSLDELARRHEVFRASFPEVGGVPRQRVSREGRIPLAVEDLRHVPTSEREAVLRERILTEYRRGFDLAQGPLLRVLLLELGGDERLLVFTLHHLIYDGWSVRVFLEELTRLYRATLADVPAALPPLPVQYADFADWQRQWLAGERLDSLLAYWRGHLAGAAPVLDLPVDRARPRRQSFRGAQRSLVLDGALTGRLRELAHAEGVSLSMIFRAAFDVLLHRYTQESDFVVGVPTAGRDQAETEGLIGVFINLLAIRSRVAGGESLRQLLPRVRRAVLEGAEHQALPFERLVAELAPARDLGRHPLFQVLFAFNQ
ncbi:MAG TPA: condensation domain-containing protein, partial [Thermoanaerobaculia bacterium]